MIIPTERIIASNRSVCILSSSCLVVDLLVALLYLIRKLMLLLFIDWNHILLLVGSTELV